MKNLNIMCDDIEALFVKLIYNCKQYVIGTVYRPPSANFEIFYVHMDTILNNLTTAKARNMSIYLMGDYNLNIDNYGIDNCVTNFVNLVYSYGMFPLINQPTRITINSQTTIDNIFISNLEHIRVSGILTIDITDHLPIFTIIKK
jgi:hypothetical protein